MRKSLRREPKKPEAKIELHDTEKHIWLRVVLLILCIAIAVGAFTYAIVNLVSMGTGWRIVKSNATDMETCSYDFTFEYYISNNAEYKRVAAAYTSATESAYKLFNADKSFDNVANLHYISHHPNSEIEVDSALYTAFELLESHGLRNHYLAPVYDAYELIFYCGSDSDASTSDPAYDQGKAEYIKTLAGYVNDPEEVNLELLEGNRVVLHVSEKYAEFAEKNNIGEYIDFFWMKDAFIIDYIAKQMIQNGYTYGHISSFDGFVRNLDTQNNGYMYNLFDISGRTIYPATHIGYTGAASIVSMRNFMIDEESEFPFYYTYRETGRCVTSYIDPKDGKDKSANANLIALAHGNESSCAELLVKMIPVYITDEKLTPSAIGLLMDEYKISAVYSDGNAVYCNDPELTFVNTYDGLTVKTVE